MSSWRENAVLRVKFLVDVLLLAAMFAAGVAYVEVVAWGRTLFPAVAWPWCAGISYFLVALAIFAAFKHTRSAYDVSLKTAVLTSLFWLPLFLMIPVLVLVVLGGDRLQDSLGRWWRARRAARVLDRWWRGR